MCAIATVVMPRPEGQPTSCSMLTNSSSAARPWITSGITSGALDSSESRPRPLKRPKRASARPVIVPSTTAKVAAIEAMTRLRSAASRICRFCSSAPYQCVEKPPHTVTSRDLLNEYTITDRIGTYRKA